MDRTADLGRGTTSAAEGAKAPQAEPGEAAGGAPGEPRVGVRVGSGLAAATAAGPDQNHGQARARPPLDLAPSVVFTALGPATEGER